MKILLVKIVQIVMMMMIKALIIHHTGFDKKSSLFSVKPASNLSNKTTKNNKTILQ